MGLKTHRLDLTSRVSEIEDRLAEIEKEKQEVLLRAQKYKNEHGEDSTLPKRLDEEWEKLEAEDIELKGERDKFIETTVVYSSNTNIVNLPPGQCTGEERSIEEISESDLNEAYNVADGCVFTVEELTFGQLQGVSDDMMEESFEVDMQREDIEGTPKQGYYQIELLREALKRWPENAPVQEGQYGNERPSPGDYPIPVGEWLFDKVDALNTRGDTEMGNSSLEEAMNSHN
jgi:hypothetical protein